LSWHCPTEKPADDNQVTVTGIFELPDDGPEILSSDHIKVFGSPDRFNLVGKIDVTRSSIEVWDEWKENPTRDTHPNGHGDYEVKKGWQ
jgi:hypothetical protein